MSAVDELGDPLERRGLPDAVDKSQDPYALDEDQAVNSVSQTTKPTSSKGQAKSIRFLTPACSGSVPGRAGRSFRLTRLDQSHTVAAKT